MSPGRGGVAALCALAGCASQIASAPRSGGRRYESRIYSSICGVRLAVKPSNGVLGKSAGALHLQTRACTPACTGSPFLLGPVETRVYWLNLTSAAGDAALVEQARACVSAAEAEECHSSADASVGTRTLLSRALLRSVLSRALLAGGGLGGRGGEKSDGSYPPHGNTQASPTWTPHLASTLPLRRSPHRKPELDWTFDERWREMCTVAGGSSPLPSLAFSLTHSAGRAGVALSRRPMVGLDVESSQRRLHLGGTKLAQRRFSAAERAQLESQPTDASKNEAFLELWTLKEALVKALGRGINQLPGLASFTFDVRASEAGAGLSLRFREGRAPASEDPAAEHAWTFWQWKEPGGFLAAACAGGETLPAQQPDTLRVFDVDAAAAFETEADMGAAFERLCQARMGMYGPGQGL